MPASRHASAAGERAETMAAVMALHGVEAPDGFGFAPSTPRH